MNLEEWLQKYYPKCNGIDGIFAEISRWDTSLERKQLLNPYILFFGPWQPRYVEVSLHKTSLIMKLNTLMPALWGLSRRALMTEPTGKRLRGRPRARCSDDISDLAWSRLGVRASTTIRDRWKPEGFSSPFSVVVPTTLPRENADVKSELNRQWNERNVSTHCTNSRTSRAWIAHLGCKKGYFLEITRVVHCPINHTLYCAVLRQLRSLNIRDGSMVAAVVVTTGWSRGGKN